jgi:hypothetical protein
MLQLKVSNFLMPSQPPKVLKLKSLKFAECLYTYLRGAYNSFVHEIWWLVKACWNGLVIEWSKFHTWLIWVISMLLSS